MGFRRDASGDVIVCNTVSPRSGDCGGVTMGYPEGDKDTYGYERDREGGLGVGTGARRGRRCVWQGGLRSHLNDAFWGLASRVWA